MPVSTHASDEQQYGDPDHWLHVIESLFVPAVQAAGYEAIRPVAVGAHLIHGLIIEHLNNSDLVLCDLSSHNPNVFFELGVRTSLNKPIALVRDEFTQIPFDTSGINTYQYASSLRGWEIEKQREALRQHILDSAVSCASENPLWRQFGLTIKAHEPDAEVSPLDARFDLLAAQVASLQAAVESENDRAMLVRFDSRRDPYQSPADRYAYVGGGSHPSAMLESMLKRYFGNTGLPYELDRRGPTDAILRVTGDWTPKDMVRARDLAERYEVRLRIEQSGLRARSSDSLDAGSGFGMGTLIPRSELLGDSEDV